jgi:hypothetical protein
MTRAERILEELKAKHFAPATVLGDGASKIRDRAGLVATLKSEARFIGTVLVVAYGAQVTLIGLIVAILFGWKPLTVAPRDLGYISAPMLLGLLELSRRMMREFVTLRLALNAAPHASDEQLQNLITSLLAGVKPANSAGAAMNKAVG